LFENLKGRDHKKDLSKYERIILEWILDKFDRKAWTGFNWQRIGTSGRLL
jgi:hypothetical protein